MLLDFKDIGDILTLDDYNALVYLLRRFQEVSETFELSTNTETGKFGKYTLTSENDNDFIYNNRGYVVNDVTDTWILSIENAGSGDYEITVKTLFSQGLVEDMDDVSLDFFETREMSFISETVSTNMKEVKIPCNLFQYGEIIQFEAVARVDYSKPLIDKLSGDYIVSPDDMLINDGDVLSSNIINAPSNVKSSFKLEPGITLELDDIIPIENKTIELVSGNPPAILDAGNNHRHFTVAYNGNLSLQNIVLRNGSDRDGGSIKVESLIDDQFNQFTGELSCESVTFANNTSTTNGGAIFSDDGIVSLKDCNFVNNEAKFGNVYGDGGAVYIRGVGTHIVIVDSVVLSANKSSYRIGDTIVLSANVYDAGGNPLENVSVNFMKSNSSIGYGTTNSSGVATFSYTPSSEEDLVLTASVDDVVSNVVNVVVSHSYAMSVSATADIIQKTETSTVTAVLKDYGNPVANQSIAYSVKHGSTVIASGTKTTGSDGKVSVSYTGTGVGDVSFEFKFGSILQETFVVEDCLKYYPLTDNTHESAFTIPSGVVSSYSSDGWNMSATNYSMVRLTDKLTSDCSVEFTISDYNTPITNYEPVIIYAYTNGETTPNQEILTNPTANSYIVFGTTINEALPKNKPIRIEYTTSTLKLYVDNVLKGSINNNIGFPTRFEWHIGANNRYAVYKDLKVKAL